MGAEVFTEDKADGRPSVAADKDTVAGGAYFCSLTRFATDV